ncbi:hypothetical protein JOD96_004139 [Flavobacterium sp. 1355]|nr:hypothetical protein [Flavobacterium sp. 1355]
MFLENVFVRTARILEWYCIFWADLILLIFPMLFYFFANIFIFCSYKLTCVTNLCTSNRFSYSHKKTLALSCITFILRDYYLALFSYSYLLALIMLQLIFTEQPRFYFVSRKPEMVFSTAFFIVM